MGSKLGQKHAMMSIEHQPLPATGAVPLNTQSRQEEPVDRGIVIARCAQCMSLTAQRLRISSKSSTFARMYRSHCDFRIFPDIHLIPESEVENVR